MKRQPPKMPPATPPIDFGHLWSKIEQAMGEPCPVCGGNDWVAPTPGNPDADVEVGVARCGSCGHQRLWVTHRLDD